MCSIICRKEAFILSDLLEDIKRLREESGIGGFIIIITRTLKRKIIDTFPVEISFYPNLKYLTGQSSNVNPYQYIVAVLKDKVLKSASTKKQFFAINY